MTRFTCFAAIALAGAALISTPAFAADSPVVGNWALVADTQMGQMTSTMSVAQAGDSYSVEIVDVAPEGAPAGGGGPAPGDMKSTISDVAINGSEFSFKRQLVTPDFTVDLNYSGTVDGDRLSGKAGSDFGDSPITGTRQN